MTDTPGRIPRMVTIKEAAAQTGLSVHHVRQLCLSREIVCINTGRKYLVNLDRFIDYPNNPTKSEQHPTTNGIRRIG